MRPHAASLASWERLGSRAVSISERPVSGRGSPPSPSSETRTVFVVFETTSGAITSSIGASRFLDGILDLPEAGDVQAARVPRLEEDRRLARETHAGRRTRRDEIAGREGHEAREVAHEITDIEDERLGVPRLHLLSVDPEPQLEDVRVRDLVPIRDVRTDRREGLGDLPGHPLAPDELEVAGAHVVDDRVAPDVVQRLAYPDEPGAAADHHPELDLPVELLRASGPEDRLARIEDRVRPLRKDRRLLGDRLICFLRVVTVVEPDG